MGIPAVTYRATPVSQRDGTALANSNCRMASIAVGLDYESAGIQTSTGAEMRARQSDQSGGTDSGDAAEAWASYGQELRIRDGDTFDDARADLGEGRLVHLDVWAESAAGPCLSGSGAYGHTIAVAPEQSGSRWLTADPWCSPARWVWWDEALLRQGAETWGAMCYGEATAGGGTLEERVLRALMRLAAKRIMTAFRPDAPALVRPPADTAGAGGRIMFTTTRAPAAQAGKEGDLPINAAAGLVTTIRARIVKGTDWFEDPNLTRRGGSMSSDADVVYVGAPVGESVPGGSYAVQVNTGSIYSDGVVRPTIIYVATADADTYSVPPPGPSGPSEAEVQAARDAEWREWLLEDSPG
jgi:hypothetical protein